MDDPELARADEAVVVRDLDCRARLELGMGVGFVQGQLASIDGGIPGGLGDC